MIVGVNHDAKASASNGNEASAIIPAETSVKAVDQTADQAKTEDTSAQESLREKVVENAIGAKGTPYLWGGNDLSVGVDSSGFVQAIYKEVGYGLPRTFELPRTSQAQKESLDEVSLDNLKPGDLIFYGSLEDNKINHVAIYIGEQKVIHAANMREGVIISDYDYRPILGAARVIKD